MPRPLAVQRMVAKPRDSFRSFEPFLADEVRPQGELAEDVWWNFGELFPSRF